MKTIGIGEVVGIVFFIIFMVAMFIMLPMGRNHAVQKEIDKEEKQGLDE